MAGTEDAGANGNGADDKVGACTTGGAVADLAGTGDGGGTADTAGCDAAAALTGCAGAALTAGTGATAAGVLDGRVDERVGAAG